jgi:hypothetical protein
VRTRIAAAFGVAISLSGAVARATVPTVSALDAVLAAVPNEPACLSVVPEPRRDASNARFFATGPTARLDGQELAAGTIAPLISLYVAGGMPRVLVLGSPIGSALRFTAAGWRARWPFC